MAHALHRLVQELPLPLAVLAGRALGSRRGRDRHDAAYYLAEATLKVAAAARIGRWLDVACAPDSTLAGKLEALVLPSLGHWCGLLRDVAAELARAPRHAFDATGAALLEPMGGPALAALARAAREAGLCEPQVASQAQKRGRLGLFELLVSYRNELIGHGAQRDAELYERLAGLILDAIVEALGGEVLFGGLRLEVAHLAVSASRRAAACRFTDLTGLVPLPLDDEVEGVLPERLYLVGEAIRVPLHPLVVCSEDERGEVRTGFLNRAFSAGDGAVRRADYLDYLSGRALADRDALEGLAELLGKLRGAPVDVESVSTLASKVEEAGGAPPPAAEELGAGTRLGHYEIERLLGSGAMGRVYAARDTRLGRDVALKVLPAELAAHPDRRRRFEREAHAVAKLAHPNVVTLHAFEEADGRSFLVMERVSGARLGTRVVPGGLPFDELLAIARPLADAVAAAHAEGVLHRDLKPDNVMLTASGTLKVLDFGLAKLFVAGLGGVGALETEEGRPLGTPAYMSPEQAEGLPVDARSDLFALGVVLFELAAGRRPFEGESAMRVVSAVLSTPAPDLAELRPDLPPRFARIVARCLVKDRARRYQSARDLATDLGELEVELLPGRARAGGARRGRVAAVSFVAGAALAGAIGLGAWRASERAAAPSGAGGPS
ncbi:MAG: serine/threonine protein kinase, partial [Myxococcales bacterium]|nr:serine/threonine protein kinase [Myxococcales bacterium]